MTYAYPYFYIKFANYQLSYPLDVNQSIDDGGNGSIYFSDHDFNFEETDFYKAGILTSSTAYHGGQIENVTYFDDGALQSYLTYSPGDDIFDGYDIFRSGKYDFHEFHLNTNWPPYSERHDSYYTKDGRFSYTIDVIVNYTGDGSGTVYQQENVSVSNPYSGSFSYSNYWRGAGRYVSENGRSVYEEYSSGDSRSMTYDANRHLTYVSSSKGLADGYVEKSWHDNLGNSFTGSYKGDTRAFEIERHADGTSTEKYFDSVGYLTKDVERQANGNFEVHLYQTGILVADNHYSDGKLAVSDKITNGSHAIVAHQSNQVLEGGILNDTFTDFGSTTFRFSGHFGSDTVRGFDSLAGPDHDIISFVGTEATELADLTILQRGANTLISLEHGDTITLVGVSIAHISADDFLFA